MEMHGEAPEVRQLRALADRLGIDIGGAKRQGVEGNTAGIKSPDVLFSRRTDSRTYFVQDRRFGIAKEGGTGFDGPDDELAARRARRHGAPRDPDHEIAESSVLTEQAQEGRFDQDTGKIELEPEYAGKRRALLTREVESLPVWSSSVLVGLNWDRSIGFLQLHWPEIPKEVVGHARKLHSVVEHQWTPPERPGAKVESAEAGIIHSPAVGFVMDFAAAIRVDLRADRRVVREEAGPLSRRERQRRPDPAPVREVRRAADRQAPRASRSDQDRAGARPVPVPLARAIPTTSGRSATSGPNPS